MKHFNNSYDGNVNLSNIPKFQPDYSPTSFQTEHFFVFLLIIIGIAGAAYTFNIGFKSSLSSNSSQITKNVYSTVLEGNISSNTLQGVSTSPLTHKAQLHIIGEKEANQKIKFTIESFDKKAEYDLIMGDGAVLHPTSKTIEYMYQKPGHYQVQLNVSYNGKSENIFSKKIHILESIAVAPKAHQEY